MTIRNNHLVVATQGRSLWILDDLTVLHQLDKESKKKELLLFKPKDAYRTKGGTSRNPSLLAGENHPNGVVTHFYVKEVADKDTLMLTYMSTSGDTLAWFSNKTKERGKSFEAKSGFNSHNWNTRIEGAERLKGMILWWANLSGPKAVPGNYKVSLSVNGKTEVQDFSIMPDPRAEVTVADMQKQYDFIKEVNETVDRAHQSIKKIRTINTRLKAFTKQYDDMDGTEDVIKMAKKMMKDFGDIEKALYQTKNRSGQDPLNFPIRLTNKLGHLNSLVSIDDFPPTEQDIAVKNELSAKIKTQLDAFDQLIDKEVEAFNKAFNSLNLNYLKVD